MLSGKLFDEEFLSRLQRLGLIAKRISAGAGASGQRKNRRLGDGLEFADHRQYTPGDDTRFLDWAYYARMEKLLLRLFHEHSEGAVSILLDQSGSMALGESCKFDYARRAAAALAYIAMASLDRVRVLPFAENLAEGVQTGRHRGQILSVLEFLEPLIALGQTALRGPVEQFARRYPQTGTVILISDLLEAEDELGRALAILRHRHDEVILLHIVDQADASPPMLGPAQLLPAESDERMPVNVTDDLLAEYARQWQAFVRGIEKTCLERSAVYVQAPTDQPFDRLVLHALTKAGVVGG